MGRMSTVLAFIVMTFLCWGSYGPVLHEGQDAMEKSLWRPFILVGVAYFLVAVCVPLVMRKLVDEPGQWTHERGRLVADRGSRRSVRVAWYFARLQ